MGKSFDVTSLPGVTFVAGLAFLALYAPIFTLVAYSFNDANAISIWGGFSFR